MLYFNLSNSYTYFELSILVLESGVIVTLSPKEEDISRESYPIMATIWTHCSINATKAGGKGQEQQSIRHFCQAMKQFIE